MSIIFQIENRVATLVLDRANKRNALSRSMIEELVESISKVANSDARVLVIQAKGPVFCAGMDLGEMQARNSAADPEAEFQYDSKIYRDLLVGLLQLPIPTIAVLQGPVLAGGVGFVLACDMVIGSENVLFALPEPRRGITAAMVTPLLIYRGGVGAASYMLLSGQRISGGDAFRFHLCHQVCAEDELGQAKLSLVESILTGSPAALALTKSHLQKCAQDDLIAQIDQSISVSAKARETEDAKEGLAAFLEKRSPNWTPSN